MTKSKPAGHPPRWPDRQLKTTLPTSLQAELPKKPIRQRRSQTAEVRGRMIETAIALLRGARSEDPRVLVDSVELAALQTADLVALVRSIRPRFRNVGAASPEAR